jgi:hypothetical protein
MVPARIEEPTATRFKVKAHFKMKRPPGRLIPVNL